MLWCITRGCYRFRVAYSKPLSLLPSPRHGTNHPTRGRSHAFFGLPPLSGLPPLAGFAPAFPPPPTFRPTEAIAAKSCFSSVAGSCTTWSITFPIAMMMKIIAKMFDTSKRNPGEARGDTGRGGRAQRAGVEGGRGGWAEDRPRMWMAEEEKIEHDQVSAGIYPNVHGTRSLGPPNYNTPQHPPLPFPCIPDVETHPLPCWRPSSRSPSCAPPRTPPDGP